MNRIAHLTSVALVLAFTVGLAAQEKPAPQTPQQIPVFQETSDARETREQWIRLLRQHPPAVAEVLQRDPSLLSRADYLAPYPALWGFLQRHPEIVRNPSFFLGEFRYYDPGPRNTSLEMFEMILAGTGIVLGVSAFLGVFVWVVRSIIDHRRWLRLSRVQADVHTKLLDRLTTNEDLLTYIQSPAGRRFLESAPITMDQEARVTTAPVGRIIWSLQAGLVLAALGAGFWFVQHNVSAEAAEGFFIIGVLALSLGIGFTVSALLAYVVSTRLGLVPKPKSTEA
ncbi:MAG TPA: hypothetical protein VIR54_19300 [Vicinamibacterales bacterium]|jgi:hypothetical protein